MRAVVFVAIVATIAVSDMGSQSTPPCVIDEGQRDPPLLGFRAQLRAAFESRDLRRLRPLVSTLVDVSAIEAPVRWIGFDAFRKAYSLDDPNSQYWDRFRYILELGGAFQEDGGFCAPSFICPGGPGLELNELLLVGVDVPAHARPDAASPVVSSLQCGPIEAATGDLLDKLQPSAAWVGIVTSGGQVAFVRSEHIAIADMVLELRRENGRWQLAAAKGID